MIKIAHGKISKLVLDVISGEEFEKKFMSGDSGTVFADFWGMNCPPCRKMVPRFEEVAQDPSLEWATFVKVNVEECDAKMGEMAGSDFGIMAIPTFVVLKGGKIAGRKTGTMTSEELKSFLASCAGNAA